MANEFKNGDGIKRFFDATDGRKHPLSLKQFCKKELKIKIDKQTAEWVLQELEKHLPFQGSNYCECSADLVYYIEQIRKELKRGKK